MNLISQIKRKKETKQKKKQQQMHIMLHDYWDKLHFWPKCSATNLQLKFPNLKKFYVKIQKFVVFFSNVGGGRPKCQNIKKKTF